SRLRIEIAGAAMMIYLQKRVIDQNGRSPSSTENSKIRCGMTDPAPGIERQIEPCPAWVVHEKMHAKQPVQD
ncbi:hypothetical protein ACEUCT_18975, partial [Aeromonas caviae]|uniref:hypothetical protein n=1 Tax=Aeromonas caviae TaxID=648 RepID=UPI0038CF663B